ncbi:hypothetical protein OsI_22335 [Oryza sativa Indica Group]|uniref:Uncharacterized protein n=1 Tax=Oryza sativa subsp. indica TaxID=39946 RepID=B8B4G4_ORYSI|nr:hypothetical protein OsI_22335 [Oryza sativa Indica Group]
MRDWQDLRTELGDEALDGDGGKLDGDTTEASRELVAGDGRAASLEEMAGRMAATTIVTNETKPVIEKATIEVYKALLPKTMVIADLGCSTGPNTMLFMSNIINMIAHHCSKLDEQDHVELQFFLNDLPGNDFNQLFRSLEKIKNSTTTCDKGDIPPSYYISGLPKSYYSRLFPRHNVHLFHSSYCLHWRSQVPEGLEASGESILNQDVYISSTSSPLVVKLFQEQFQKDFSFFLQLRHEELVNGGRMVLIFLGRKDEDVYKGDLNHMFGFVSKALESLVEKGLVSKEKLESFILPVYGPSVDEVKEIVAKSRMFDLDHIKLFEANWDPYDDSEGDVVLDSANSSLNIRNLIRSVLESMIASHFGGSILDAIFQEFRSLVAQHLKREKTKFAVIVMSLKKIY